MSSPIDEGTCELCGRVYRTDRRRWHCDHCKVYYFVCPECEAGSRKCRLCGIPLKKKMEPTKRRP